MMTRHGLTLSASSLAIALLALAAPAAAQQVTTNAPAGSEIDPAVPAPSGAAPATAASATDLSEVIVTARKRPESVITTPVSVVALNAQALQNRGISNLQTLQDFTPGFKFQNQSVNRNDRAFNTLVMRGLYPGSDSSDRQVATVFIDGVPLHGGLIPGLTDVERVEVVLGPQSAYFGRSTFAGAVNFVTTPAGFDFKGAVTADVARFDYKDIRASVEGGLTDTLAVRVSGRYYDQDGQYRNAGYGTRLGAQQTKAGSIAFTFKPTSNLTVRAYGTIWRDEDGSPASGQLYAADYNCNPAGGAVRNYICGRIKEVPANRIAQNNEVGPAIIARLNNSLGASLFGGDFSDDFGLQRHAMLGNLIANYQFDSGWAISALFGANQNKRQFITDTEFRDTRGFANPSFGVLPAALLPYRQSTVLGQEEIKNHSAELRVSSPQDKPLNVTGGVNYFHKSLETSAEGYADSGALIDITPPRAEIADTYGAFAAITYKLGDFSISGEGRVQRDKIQSNAYTSAVAGQPPLRLKDSFDSFTPRVILQYNPTRNINVYASYAEGTRPGEFNNAYYSRSPAIQALVTAQGIAVPVAVGEERLKMGELGFKGQLLDNRLRLLAAVYYGRWNNKHIQQNVTYPTVTVPVTFQVITGGGKVRAQGIELQSAFKASDALLFEGTFNIADTNIRKSFCLECLALTGNANQVGQQLPKYSRIQASASVAYSRPLSGTLNGFVRTDLVYASRQYESEANLTWVTPGVRTNLRAGIRTDRYKFELFGTNIFNNKNPTAVSRNTDALFGGNTISVSPALRTTYGVSVGATF